MKKDHQSYQSLSDLIHRWHTPCISKGMDGSQASGQSMDHRVICQARNSSSFISQGNKGPSRPNLLTKGFRYD